MLKSPKLLRSSFRRKTKVEKVEKEDKKIFKNTTRWSAEGYAQETATQINYDLNFFRKKVLYLQTSNFHSLFYHDFYFKILTKGKII